MYCYCAGSLVKDIKKTSAGLMVETDNGQQLKKSHFLKKVVYIDVEEVSMIP